MSTLDRRDSLFSWIASCEARPECIKAATRYLCVLAESNLPPLACVTANDGVSLEWDTGDVCSTIEFQDESVVEVTEFAGEKLKGTSTFRWQPSMGPICLAALAAVGVEYKEATPESEAKPCP